MTKPLIYFLAECVKLDGEFIYAAQILSSSPCAGTCHWWEGLCVSVALNIGRGLTPGWLRRSGQVLMQRPKKSLNNNCVIQTGYHSTIEQIIINGKSWWLLKDACDHHLITTTVKLKLCKVKK